MFNNISKFIDYLTLIDKSSHTIRAYISDLKKFGDSPETLINEQIQNKLSHLNVCSNSKARIVSSLKSYFNFLETQLQIKVPRINIPIKTSYFLPKIKSRGELKDLLKSYSGNNVWRKRLKIIYYEYAKWKIHKYWEL